jgi:hypothetical protein
MCNAPGVVGVESDAGNRECDAVLFNAPKHNTVCSQPKIHDQEQTRSSTTKQKVTIINPSGGTRRAG